MRKGFLQEWLKWGPRKAGEWSKSPEAVPTLPRGPSPADPGLDCTCWLPAGGRVGRSSGPSCGLRRRYSAPGAWPRAPEPPDWTPGRHLSYSSFQVNLAAEREAWRGAQKAPGPNSTWRVCRCRTQQPGRVFCSATYVCLCLRENEGCRMGVEFHFTL